MGTSNRGLRKLSRAIFTYLLANGNLGVMSQRHAQIQGNSSRLAETGRDRSRRHASERSGPSRFAFDSRADNRDEAVGSPITRSLSERWLIVWFCRSFDPGSTCERYVA